MTTPSDDDQTANTEASDTPPEHRPIWPVAPIHQVPDGNLAAIADASYFLGFPVTLYMPWGIASGHTAPYNEYYKHLAERARGGELAPGMPEGSAEVIDNFAKNNFDRFAEIPYSDRTTFQDGFDLTSFVNLKDALCWIGGFPQPFRHDYLRLRLADITAWAWGNLRP
ncbi:hypothetical protein [Mycobacterium sp. 050134]|uniref:hypothetical protein n=1 Tax=Mycobacterium sp. 050134 TaxID=3096111 RepID=UPI002ED9E02B